MLCRRQLQALCTLGLLLGLLAWGSPAQELQSIPAPLAQELPALMQQSTWGQDGTLLGTDQGAAFLTGNGQVFASMGQGANASTMQNMAGPQYKDSLGELSLVLWQQDRPLVFDQQRLRRVRASNILLSEDKAKNLSLRCLTFAAPDTSHFVRVTQVHNAGSSTCKDLQLSYHQPIKQPAIKKLSIPDLAAGASWLAAGRIETKTGKLVWQELSQEQALEETQACLQWWQDTLERSPSLDMDQARLLDLLEDWKVNILCLRCTQSGVVVPMLGQREASLRQCSGPMLLLLRYNMWEEAKQLLRFFHHAAASTGELRESYPLDLAANKNSQVDWTKLQVAQGDLASWSILLHFWYYRATRDQELCQAHLPFLEACLKKQARYQDCLVQANASEHGLPGQDMHALSGSTLFLMALQAYGEILNGVQENGVQPQQGEVPPGQKYLERSFKIMTGLEQQFWQAGDGQANPGYFAPALSGITGAPLTEPLAAANLLPLWIGWTFPSGEKSRHNLSTSIQRLQTSPQRLGHSQQDHGFAGEVPGMLLTALTERDGVERSAVIEDLLRLASPSGAWSKSYSAAGQPSFGPCSPRVSGINVDALFFALTGVRHAAVPNFDNKSIKLKLRLPQGASFLSMQNLRKDGRAFNIWVKESWQRLDEQELEHNASLPETKRRDANEKHRRFEFRMELLGENPAQGYYQVDAKVAGTTFVRYLLKDQPIHEREFWHDDALTFFRAADSRPAAWSYLRLAKAKGETLLLTGRPSVATAMQGEGITVVDSRLPLEGKSLQALLLDEKGKLQHARLHLDWRFDHGQDFWASTQWQQMLKAYGDAGGQVIQGRQ